MTSNDKIEKIQQILQRLTAAINSNSGLQGFDSVEIPFQLTQACIQLWTDCFSIPILQNLSNTDPDTLEAWAIALNTTLQVQLGILNQWMPLLGVPCLPPKLQEKAEQRTSELEQIANQKSALLKAAPNLLAQEKELRHAAIELSGLRAKFQELRAIEADICATDLAKLQAEVRQKESDVLPQKQILDQLYEQKANIETQIDCLHQQQKILESEIEEQKLCQKGKELGVMSQIRKLLELTETAKAELSIPTAEALNNLDSQRQEYNLQWERLQQTIIAYNQYRAETKAIYDDLDAHYQADAVLGQRLPIDRRRIEKIMQAIKKGLAELDCELMTAHAHHERSQQKQYITFGG
jgi:hypothetical protein